MEYFIKYIWLLNHSEILPKGGILWELGGQIQESILNKAGNCEIQYNNKQSFYHRLIAAPEGG